MTRAGARIFAAAAILVGAAGLRAQAAATAQPTKPTAASIDNGRRLYERYACFYCHGTTGAGSAPGIGPRIATVPQSLEGFRRYVRRPAGRMTGYSEKILSDTDLADIYAFLRSQPPARPVTEIPLLEQLKKPR